MDGPEDKGPRYRLVMFVAIAAIVGPGLFLLNWIGDNGVNNLFRSLLGVDQPHPRVTTTATPGTVVAVVSPGVSPTSAATVVFTSTAVTAPAATATTAPVPATPAGQVTPPAAATQPPAPVASDTPRPPMATSTPRAPTATPNPDYLGRGVAVPAYGGAAVIRAEPNTDAEALASIPLDEQVVVRRLVEGEAIDPVESRWWEVDYGEVHGFVYYKLIKLQE